MFSNLPWLISSYTLDAAYTELDKVYSCNTSHFQMREPRVSTASRKQNDAAVTSMTQAEGEGVTQSPSLYF